MRTVTFFWKTNRPHGVLELDRILQLNKRNVVVVIYSRVAAVLDSALHFVLLRFAFGGRIPVVFQYPDGHKIWIESVEKENSIDCMLLVEIYFSRLIAL